MVPSPTGLNCDQYYIAEAEGKEIVVSSSQLEYVDEGYAIGKYECSYAMNVSENSIVEVKFKEFDVSSWYMDRY